MQYKKYQTSLYEKHQTVMFPRALSDRKSPAIHILYYLCTAMGFMKNNKVISS